jgi:hypothetical protein
LCYKRKGKESGAGGWELQKTSFKHNSKPHINYNYDFVIRDCAQHEAVAQEAHILPVTSSQGSRKMGA